MTLAALSVVRKTRRLLTAIALGTAAAWGLAVAICTHRMFDSVAAALLTACLTVGFILRQVGMPWSLERIALWIEEHDHQLCYVLVTAVDPRYRSEAGQEPIRLGVAGVDPGPFIRRSALGKLIPALLFMLAAFFASQATREGRVDRLRSLLLVKTGGQSIRNRLAILRAEVRPPAYTTLPTQVFDEPTTIASLEGSEVSLRGVGSPDGIRATLKDRLFPASRDGPTGWRITFAMPSAPGLVGLKDGPHGRLVALAPISDTPPTVSITLPTRDSVLRDAAALLSLSATATDDFGLADGWFELIVTSGEEERGGVQGRTFEVGRRAFAKAKVGVFQSAVSFHSLDLQPGNVLSIRAVARDINNVTGPRIGVSETRTLRMLTTQENDSIAVEGANPPPVDSGYMSQRMIVDATRRLLHRIDTSKLTSHHAVVIESRRLWERQDALRMKSEALLSAEVGTAGGGAEALSIAERQLLERARASMVNAADSLAIALPRAALPFELTALAALDSARLLTKRLYLRGSAPQTIVNVGRVRLTGKEEAQAGSRPPMAPVDTLVRTLVRRFESIAKLPLDDSLPGLAEISRDALVDSLMTLSVDAQSTNASLAALFADAANVARVGGSLQPGLARARRMLMGRIAIDTSAVAWE